MRVAKLSLINTVLARVPGVAAGVGADAETTPPTVKIVRKGDIDSARSDNPSLLVDVCSSMRAC
jgi:hypothetical protein